MGWFSTLLGSPQQLASASGHLPHEYGHDWALVDVETSGLRAGQHRVLQVAVITMDATGRQTDEFSTLLNAGCDPGPTHIHGITSAHLHGAPTFQQVAPRVASMLEGRTLVAHNASFDYDHLRHEFVRAGAVLPVQRRLCTLALNRRLGTPSADMRLGTLAEHYRVPQQRSHDALDDTRVLAGILRASLHAASSLGIGLPLVTCPPKGQGGDAAFAPNIAKSPCSFASPGRWSPGAPLVQGMKVALTGDTRLAREELVRRGVRAGLNMMCNVSRHTSVLVTNDRSSGSAKADRARLEGVPVVNEAVFLGLLSTVRPGLPLDQAVPAVPAQRAPDATQCVASRPQPKAAPSQPLTGRRILVLGSDHAAKAAARSAVVDFGAAVAVNLSGNVTDVLALERADTDKRWGKIQTLGLPLRHVSWLDNLQRDGRLQLAGLPAPAEVVSHAANAARAAVMAGRANVDEDVLAVESAPEPAVVLARGQAVDLPKAGSWTFAASWSSDNSSLEVDVVAFVLDQTEQVTSDDGMAFYNNPTALDGAVGLVTDGPNEQTVTVDLNALPAWVQRITIAAAIDDDTATFADIGAVALCIGPGGDAAAFAEATLDAATIERTMSLLELYRREEGWRVRPIGQGWTTGLAELAVLHGVDVDEDT